jgi:hypothetical protein
MMPRRFLSFCDLCRLHDTITFRNHFVLSTHHYSRRAGRRTTYEALFRIAIANIFVGACIIMLWSIKSHAPGSLFGPSMYLGGARWWFPTYPWLLPFCLSLGVVAAKAFRVRVIAKRASVLILTALIAPYCLLITSFRLNSILEGVLPAITPDDTPVVRSFYTRCEVDSEKLHASGYLKLDRPGTLLMLSDAGHGASLIAAIGRHPKPSTN